MSDFHNEFNSLKADNSALPDWLKLLRRLVAINSDSRNAQGVNQVQNLLENLLQQKGFRIQRVENQEHESGDMLIAEYLPESESFVNLVCHADTVFDAYTVPHQTHIKDNIMSGPGVIDNKGGIIVSIWGMLKHIESSSPKVGLRWFCSPNEELGSVGFQHIYRKAAPQSIATLGFEPAFENGSLITGRKGNLWYDVHIKGQSAHAGRDHNLGANACSELAMILSQVHTLTNYDQEVTVNVGKIMGGSRHNVVSDEAYGQLDLRFPCFATRKDIQTQVENVLNSPQIRAHKGSSKTQVSYEIVDDCPPLPETENNIRLARFVQDELEKWEGRKVETASVGGAADCNYFCMDDSAMVIDGLGPIGAGMHTPQESLVIESLKTRSDAVAHLLAKLARQ